MSKPLVSIICLCHNHGRFVGEAIESVLNQDYDAIELIVVDDYSTDDSRDIIKALSNQHAFKTILTDANLGNCAAFNLGFRASGGAYLIDLAADDILLPSRVSKGVDNLESRSSDYGVEFCDVELLLESSESEGTHFKRNADGELIEKVPEGDVYKNLVERYVINTPGMMIRRQVLDDLNGYDESLSYEDFDFWVRSSRKYHYAFTNDVLVQKRLVDASLSSQQLNRKNKHALSTAKVCKKAKELNKTKEEDEALLRRINYELKWALITENWEAANKFISIKQSLNDHSIRLFAEKLVLKLRPPWYSLWKKLL